MNTSSHWSRAWRLVCPGRNPLARREDRVEAFTVVLAIVLVIVALPVAAAVASGVFAARSEQAATEQATRYRGEATLLEDGAPIAIGGRAGAVQDTSPAEAMWVTRDGGTRVGEVQATRGTLAGAKVPVWLDESGNAVDAPTTVLDARLLGVGTGVGLWLASSVVVLVAQRCGRLLLDRARWARWQEEWREFAPR
ncbi:Rv1733c family protein [Amycolatopsis lurida]|uniref:Rv1733c family protein n=1 Tax=Amycolatopsis lurida TaxID=31959 RepID=UPI00365E572E